MKTIGIVLIGFMLLGSSNVFSQKTFYDFKVSDISGEEFAFSELKGKKVLVVNTASKCGYTDQYADLEKLFKEYGGENFVIIGFPANDFMKQEPGTNDEIASFCKLNYGVSFPMMAKITVKGKDMHPLYSWLTQKEKNGVLNSNVKWNFQKYMIGEDGILVDYANPGVKPYDEKILNWVKM